jgi:hypothetical protein
MVLAPEGPSGDFCNWNFIKNVNGTSYRQYVSLDPKGRKTLSKYIIKLADIVGLKIKEKIGKGGKCISDDWSCSGVHYIAVYHSWPHRAWPLW